MRRRTLLGGGASAVALAPLAACRPWMRKDPAPAGEAPSAHQLATIDAIAATFIPSSDGSPGALEAGAREVILDPSHPVAGYLSELVSDLDDWCFVRHGARRFVELSPARREQALEERMGLHGRLIQSWYLPVYEGVLALTKLAFFGGLTRRVGTTFVGFPGPSAGYAAASAAGVYRARGAIAEVSGPGRVSEARVTALLAGVDLARAPLHLIAPDGSRHPLATDAGAPPPLTLDAVVVPGTRGTTAAGSWRLDPGAGAVVTAWWLALRTELDEPGGG